MTTQTQYPFITIEKTFNINIIITENIIDVSKNLKEYIVNFINKNILHHSYKNYFLFELIDVEYFFPQVIANKLNIKNKFKINTFIKTKCIKFFKSQLIDFLTLELDNKLGDILLLKNTINDIEFCGIDMDFNNYEKYEKLIKQKKKIVVKIKDIKYLFKNINFLVDFVDVDNYKSDIVSITKEAVKKYQTSDYHLEKSDDITNLNFNFSIKGVFEFLYYFEKEYLKNKLKELFKDIENKKQDIIGVQIQNKNYKLIILSEDSLKNNIKDKSSSDDIDCLIKIFIELYNTMLL